MKAKDQNPKMAKNVIFVHSALDDAGLSPSEFRVFAHVSRRGKCWAAVKTIAEHCRIHPDTARKCLKSLVERNFLLRETRRAKPTIYEVNHGYILKNYPIQNKGQPYENKGGQPYENKGGQPYENKGGLSQIDGVHLEPLAHIPTKAEVVDFGKGAAAIPEFYCSRFHERKTEANTWLNKQGQLKKWRQEIVRWFNEDGRPKKKNEGHGKIGKRGFDRNEGTKNDPSDYANVGSV